MSDINWAGLNNRRNPFNDLAEGLQYGTEMRRDRQKAEREDARLKAYNLFATDPVGAEKALMAAGDVQGAENLRERREGQDQRFRRGMLGMMVGKGDLPAAQAKAMQVGEYDMAANIGKLDEQQRKIAQENAEDFAGFLVTIRGQQYDARRNIIQKAKPILAKYGLTAEAVDGFDPTDSNIEAKIAEAMTLKTALDEAARKADDNRADEQLAETKRSNTVREGISRGQLGVAQGGLAVRRAAHDARVKAGGYGTPGAFMPGGVVPDEDVEEN
jgi:hypothetical protein